MVSKFPPAEIIGLGLSVATILLEIVLGDEPAHATDVLPVYKLKWPQKFANQRVGMMTLYPPLESGETHRLQHVAEVRFRLEKERDFRASTYKKYRREANVADGIDTGLSVISLGLAASGVGLLSTIIAAPVAIGLQAGSIMCGMLWAGGKLVGRRLQANARKHDLIRGLAESKLNTMADRISVALNDDKITEEKFLLMKKTQTIPA